MADGVAITAGAGTTILTDDTGAGGHAQVMKLAISTDGSATLIPAEASNGLDVDVTRVQGTVAIGGDVAHDTANSGNPVQIGYVAKEYKATPTAVTAGDRVAQPADRTGLPFVIGGHPNIETLIRKDTAAQTDAILKAVGAAERFVITGIVVFCSNANTVDVQALVEFDNTTDVVVMEHPAVARGGGFVVGNGGGILGVGATGQDVLWTCTVPTSGSVTVHVIGYLIAV